MSTTRIPATCCPSCGCHVAAHTSTGGDFDPTPGGIAICVSCAQILVLTDDLKLRMATDSERTMLLEHPNVVDAVAAVMLMLVEDPADSEGGS